MCTVPSKKTMAFRPPTAVGPSLRLAIELQTELQLTNRFVGRFYSVHAMAAEIMGGVLHAKFGLAQCLERIPDFGVGLRCRRGSRGSRRSWFRTWCSRSRDRERKRESNGYHTE